MNFRYGTTSEMDVVSSKLAISCILLLNIILIGKYEMLSLRMSEMYAYKIYIIRKQACRNLCISGLPYFFVLPEVRADTNAVLRLVPIFPRDSISSFSKFETVVTEMA